MPGLGRGASAPFQSWSRRDMFCEPTAYAIVPATMSSVIMVRGAL